jgi:hypothetical protein
MVLLFWHGSLVPPICVRSLHPGSLGGTPPPCGPSKSFSIRPSNPVTFLPPCPVHNSFRIHTCKSLSIQRTSTSLRTQTYKKPRGRGELWSTKFRMTSFLPEQQMDCASPYSSGPSPAREGSDPVGRAFCPGRQHSRRYWPPLTHPPPRCYHRSILGTANDD